MRAKKRPLHSRTVRRTNVAGKRSKKAAKADDAGGSRRSKGKRQHRGRSGPGAGLVLLGIGLLTVVGVIVVFMRQGGVADIEVPVPPNLESFDPQVRSYIKEHIAMVQAAPGEAESYATLGLVYGDNKLWYEARTCYGHAARLDPLDPLPRHYQAVASDELGEHDAGFAEFGEITREFPDFAAAQHRYGVGLLSRGRLQEAAAHFERVVALVPDAPEGYVGLGEIKLREGEYAAATERFEKGLQLAPQRRRTRYLLGTAYLKLGRQAQARKYLSGSVNNETNYLADAWTQVQRSHAMILADQIDRALALLGSNMAARGAEILEEALSWHPNNVDVANNLGIIYMNLGQPERARDLLQQSVEYDDSRFETHINLAAARNSLGDLESALQAIDRAVELAPGAAQAHLTRARILVKLQRAADAVEAYRAVLRYDSENLGVRVELAGLYMKFRRYSEAKEQFR